MPPEPTPKPDTSRWLTLPQADRLSRETAKTAEQQEEDAS